MTTTDNNELKYNAEAKPATGPRIGSSAWLGSVAVWLRNLKNWKIKRAYRDLTRAMKRDAEYAHSWQCNIAMPIYDGAKGKLSPAEANAIADRLMKHLFDVPNVQSEPRGSNQSKT